MILSISSLDQFHDIESGRDNLERLRLESLRILSRQLNCWVTAHLLKMLVEINKRKHFDLEMNYGFR